MMMQAWVTMRQEVVCVASENGGLRNLACQLMRAALHAAVLQ